MTAKQHAGATQAASQEGWTNIVGLLQMDDIVTAPNQLGERGHSHGESLGQLRFGVGSSQERKALKCGPWDKRESHNPHTGASLTARPNTTNYRDGMAAPSQLSGEIPDETLDPAKACGTRQIVEGNTKWSHRFRV
jgi:hypothetical protein